jgi:hypothetical protein
MLRSTLEGLLFEQADYLNTPTRSGEFVTFQLKGHHADFNLTQVYFNASAWDSSQSFEVSFDDGDHVTKKDVTHFLLYFGMLDYMIKEIRVYLMKHVRGNNYWKHKAFRYMSSIQKSQRYVVATLLDYLE